MVVQMAARPSQQEEAAYELAARRRTDDMRAVLATEEGKRVLWRIAESCGTFKSLKAAGTALDFYAGRQDVGMEIVNEIKETNFPAWLKMQEQAHKEKSNG